MLIQDFYLFVLLYLAHKAPNTTIAEFANTVDPDETAHPGGGGGHLLVNSVPMREQRTAKLTLNDVFDILKLIPLFTLSSQKVNLSNVVNSNAYSLILQPFVKHILFSYKNSIFPTLNDDSTVHCPA